MFCVLISRSFDRHESKATYSIRISEHRNVECVREGIGTHMKSILPRAAQRITQVRSKPKCKYPLEIISMVARPSQTKARVKINTFKSTKMLICSLRPLFSCPFLSNKIRAVSFYLCSFEETRSRSTLHGNRNWGKNQMKTKWNATMHDIIALRARGALPLPKSNCPFE